MKAQRLLEIFEQADCIERGGPFTLHSGRETNVRINAERIFEHDRIAKELSICFAGRLKKANINFDTIIGVANGGVPFAEALADAIRALGVYKNGKASKISWIEASKVRNKDGMYSFHIPASSITLPGTRVLVLDDVGTTGKALRAAIRAAWDQHLDVAAAGCFIKRGRKMPAKILGKPVITLNDEPLEDLR